LKGSPIILPGASWSSRARSQTCSRRT
jgi:hypothetical protein